VHSCSVCALTTRFRRPVAARVSSDSQIEMTELLTEHPLAIDFFDRTSGHDRSHRRTARHQEPRRMLCAHRAPAPDTHLLSSRVFTTARRCTERRATRRSIACGCTVNARSPAAQRLPALARTLTALGAAAVLSFSVAGACHANELFQKTCAGARLSGMSASCGFPQDSARSVARACHTPYLSWTMLILEGH